MTHFYDDAHYNIPAGERAALYFNGKFAATEEIKLKYPRHFLIAVKSGDPSQASGARCLDVEQFDAKPADAPLFAANRLALGFRPATIYCSLDTVPAVVSAFLAFHKAGDLLMPWRLWVAHWDDTTARPVLPGLIGGVLWAKQFHEGVHGDPDVSVLYGEDDFHA